MYIHCEFISVNDNQNIASGRGSSCYRTREDRTFRTRDTKLRAGYLIRLVIDPNKWWGRDLTRIDRFEVVPSEPHEQGADEK